MIWSMPRAAKVIAEAGQKLTPRSLRQAGRRRRREHPACPRRGDPGQAILAADMINEDNGLIYIEAGDEIDEERTAGAAGCRRHRISTRLDIDNITIGAYMRNTLAADKNHGREGALMDIYRVMRPGEPPTVEAARRCSNRCSSMRALRPVRRWPRQNEHAPGA